jgi:hypothetical protein
MGVRGGKRGGTTTENGHGMDGGEGDDNGRKQLLKHLRALPKRPMK